MSIKSELSVLKVNIQNAKDKLYTNLVDKGVTYITTASTLDAMANSVSDIVTGTSSGGGNPFEAIGYEATPQYIQDDIDYSQTIYDNWDSSINSCYVKFKDDKQLVYFPQVDTSNVTTMESMFNGCTYLQYVPQINTSNVRNMYSMFMNCSGLTSLDVSNFDTSNVTNMSNMFMSCKSLASLDVSNFDTSNVTTMGYMFSSCIYLTSLNLSSFDTSKVTNMSSMFNACSGLTSLDVSNFNTSKVTNMSSMFSYCSGLTSLDLSSFDTSKVTDMSYMFSYSSGLASLDLSNFDTSKVTKTNNMFYYSTSLTEIHWNNFGNGSGYTAVSFSNSSKLGVNTTDYPNAKQSIVNTFITNSFDRATAGYKSCKITLHANTKAVLTDDEIAAITAKGYTIA